MKRTYILLLIFSIATSCNLKEKLQKIEKINSELKKEFKHSEINSTYSFGTEENDDFFQINFFSYALSEKTHSELENMADKVHLFFREKHPEYNDLDYIEVRFSKFDKENTDSFVNFKFK
jgi:hypothetical protein|tara:strand:+ start:525 stop:884 length:360 start_codon:yes stop_codon:yes gene_type:complete